MDEIPPQEAGAQHDGSPSGCADSDAPSLRWEVRAAPRREGVSAGLASLLPVPAIQEVAGRPVLEQLAAAVHLAEAAASLPLWPLAQDELDVSVRLLSRLSGALDRCQVAVIGEAHTRGAGTASGRSTVDWVIGQSRGRIPAARAAQLLRVARCAQQPALTGQPEQATQGGEAVRVPESGWERIYTDLHRVHLRRAAPGQGRPDRPVPAPRPPPRRRGRHRRQRRDPHRGRRRDPHRGRPRRRARAGPERSGADPGHHRRRALPHPRRAPGET